MGGSTMFEGTMTEANKEAVSKTNLVSSDSVPLQNKQISTGPYSSNFPPQNPCHPKSGTSLSRRRGLCKGRRLRELVDPGVQPWMCSASPILLGLRYLSRGDLFSTSPDSRHLLGERLPPCSPPSPYSSHLLCSCLLIYLLSV